MSENDNKNINNEENTNVNENNEPNTENTVKQQNVSSNPQLLSEEEEKKKKVVEMLLILLPMAAIVIFIFIGLITRPVLLVTNGEKMQPAKHLKFVKDVVKLVNLL